MRQLNIFMLLIGLCLTAALALAQTETAPAPKAEAQQPPPSVPDALANPRATMGTFLAAMNDIKRGKPERIEKALQTLDLSEVSSLVRKERGTDLAWMLLEVLDRTRLIDLKAIPDAAKGDPWVFHRYDNGEVRISRHDDGRWLFDAETLAALPALLEELSSRESQVAVDNNQWLPPHIRLEQQLPDWLKSELLSLKLWQWLALLLTIALGVVADKIAQLLGVLFMRLWLRRFNYLNDYLLDADQRLRPLGLLAMALIWWLGVRFMGLPESVLLVLLVAVKLLASISAVWTTWRLVDLVSAWLLHKAMATENRVDDVLVPMITKTLKIFIAVGGLIFIADNLSIDITGLLAGLGLGGLAFALAAKDMVQNLFGSITVIMDRTFTVGDWIIVDDIEGTVEHMGLRSTRVRTFYNSLVTIPNSRFITADVDNMGARRYRRYKARFGLEYDTPPELVDAFCEGLREIVRQHPYMRKDYFQIWFNHLGDSALEVLVYVFWETPDWTAELRERHRFLLDALRLAEALGVNFAFPTQTLHLYQEDAKSGFDSPLPDQEKARELARSIATRSIMS